MRSRDGGTVADGLRGIFVGGGGMGTVMRAVDLRTLLASDSSRCSSRREYTPDIARRTRSFLMRPDAARLEMSSAFVLPVQRQAILDEFCPMVKSCRPDRKFDRPTMYQSR